MGYGDPEGGRPTECNARTTQIICDAVRAGNYLKVAAELVGLHPDTIRQWRHRGERERREPYATFAREIDEAMAASEATCVRIIVEAATGFDEVTTEVTIGGKDDGRETRKVTHRRDWRAALALLERRFPERWGRAGSGGGDDSRPVKRIEIDVDPRLLGRVGGEADCIPTEDGE